MTTSVVTSAVDVERRSQLSQDGFCIFEQLVAPPFIADLRRCSEALVEAQGAANEGLRAQGSLLPVTAHPIYAELIAYPPLLDALKKLGYHHPAYSDGYIISKPGRSPRLFWHYDWFSWEDPSSFEVAPSQLFAMIYLSDTRPENGCLRVIPDSHIRHNPLHDLLREPHSKALSEARDLTLPEFSARPDEVDVPVRAGDLLIGDARLLHAAHANQTDARRTLITLWYQPDFAALPERIQAQMAAKTQKIPHDWPGAAKVFLEPLLANLRYSGNAEPYGRSLYPRRAVN